MFEFYGVLSQPCLKVASKIQNKRNFFIAIIPVILAVIVTTVFGILKLFNEFYEFLALTIILLIISICILIVPAKSAVFRLPIKIIFDIDKNSITISREGLNDNNYRPKTKSILSIKSIIDYGDWYLVTFKGDITDNFVCQKDLLIQGSLEDLENTFKDKIKYPKKKAI